MIDTLTEVRDETGKPVLLVFFAALSIGEMQDLLGAQEAFINAGFPVFHSMRHLSQAMARVIAWQRRMTTTA